MNYWSLIIPIFSGLLGWFLTRIAGKILVYRVIPSRQQQLAEVIGKTVKAEFSFADLEKKIVDPSNIQSVMPVVESHVDDFLRHKLKEKMPVIGMFIGDKTIHSLKEVFLKEIEALFPQVLQKFAGGIKDQLDIETLVKNKITSVSASRIEKSLEPVLDYYSIAGAITGFVIGAINLLFFFFLNK
ncbi:MAG TPA: hypothetical protein VFI06_08750 [Chitinophagaceae bacterium]|nr:hypothetical protein [Chitinophagaceae bacterium]